MLAELSADELAEWQAYYFLEPWGDDWHRTALLATILSEVNRDDKKRGEPYGPDDFLPKLPELEFYEFGDGSEEESRQAVDTNWKSWKALLQGMLEATSAPTKEKL